MSARPPKIPAVEEAVRYAVRSREGLRAGLLDAREKRFHPPPPDEHARRFLYGFALPVTLLRIAWGDAAIKRSIIHRLLPPVACVALVATLGTVSLLKELAEAHGNVAALSAGDDEQDDDDDDEAPAATKARKDSDKVHRREAAKVVRGALAQATQADAERVRAKSAANGKEDTEDTEDSVARAAADAVRSAGEQALAIQHQIDPSKKDTEATADEDRDDEKPPARREKTPSHRSAAASFLAFVKSRITQLVAALGALELFLIWIGREHHDQIAFDIAMLTSVPGEPLARPPRLRLDFGWLKTKAWRAVRFLLFVALGSPFAWVVGMIPEVGKLLAILVEAGWVAYWASVFGIANSFLVWERPLGPTDLPWFIRVLRAADGMPVLGSIAGLYTRLLTKATQNVWPACMAFEAAPWEAAGLAALRGLFSVPVVYLVTRPAFAPAATHAWLARAPAPPPAVLDDAPPYEVPPPAVPPAGAP